MPPDPTSAPIAGVCIAFGVVVLVASMLPMRWRCLASAAVIAGAGALPGCSAAVAAVWLCVAWALGGVAWLVSWTAPDDEAQPHWTETPEGQAKVDKLRAVVDSMGDETRAAWLNGGQR